MAPDSTDANVVKDIELTLDADKSWQDAITAVEVDGAVLDKSSNYVIDGKITLHAMLFTEAKDYHIVVKAANYTKMQP